MSRELLVELARRTIAHARAGTVPQAESIARVPADRYHDADRWQLEVDRVFRRVPLVLGFSTELAEPGSYRALEAAGVPVLLSRGADGVMRCFVNMCSHRGAIVVAEGTGSARRFTCPYHAWSYDTEGALVGVLDRSEFGSVDPVRDGLVELPCEERSGLIFAALTPTDDLRLDAFLAGYDDLLDHLDLAGCRLVGRQSVVGPNWKIAFDGYLDLYHLPVLHRDTFGPEMCNKAVYDAWGPHQRVTSPDRHVLGWADTPERDWTMRRLTGGVWTIFPHVSIARFETDGGSVYLVSQLFPGSEPGRSMTTQSFLATFDPTDEQQVAIDEQMDFLLRVVRDEDYRTGAGIQRALRTGVKTDVLFGRNEAGGQRFHAYLDRLVATADDEGYRSLLASHRFEPQP